LAIGNEGATEGQSCTFRHLVTSSGWLGEGCSFRRFDAKFMEQVVG